MEMQNEIVHFELVLKIQDFSNIEKPPFCKYFIQLAIIIVK